MNQQKIHQIQEDGKYSDPQQKKPNQEHDSSLELSEPLLQKNYSQNKFEYNSDQEKYLEGASKSDFKYSRFQKKSYHQKYGQSISFSGKTQFSQNFSQNFNQSAQKSRNRGKQKERNLEFLNSSNGKEIVYQAKSNVRNQKAEKEIKNFKQILEKIFSDLLPNKEQRDPEYDMKAEKKESRKMNFLDLFFFKLQPIKSENQLIIIWEILVSFTYIVQFFQIPLVIFFKFGTKDRTYVNEASWYSYLFLFMQIFDIILRFFRCYYELGIAITNRSQIIQHYLKGLFILDTVVLASYILQFTIIAQWFPIIYLVFYLKIENLSKFNQKILRMFQLHRKLKAIYLLLRLMLVVMIISHLFASLYYAIHDYVYFNMPNTQTWVTDCDVSPDLIDEPWYVKYAFALYWAVTTMSTVGYGDVHPVNNYEITYATFAMLNSCIFFAYAINSIYQIFENTREGQKRYERNYDAIGRFMRDKQVEKKLQLQVGAFLEFNNKEKNRERDVEEQVIKSLPPVLKNKLIYRVYGKNFLGRVPWLKQQNVPKENYNNPHFNKKSLYIFSKAFLYELSNQVEEQYYSKDEIVYSVNDRYDQNDDDYSHSFYFVAKGEFQECFDNFPLYNNGQGINLRSYKLNDWFGDLEFLTGENRRFSIKATNYSLVYKISRSNFLETLKDFPDDYEKYCNLKDQLMFSKMNKDKFQKLQMQCYFCGYKNHLANRCPKTHYYITPAKYQFICKEQQNNRIQKERKEKLKFNAYIDIKQVQNQRIQYLNEMESFLQKESSSEFDIQDNYDSEQDIFYDSEEKRKNSSTRKKFKFLNSDSHKTQQNYEQDEDESELDEEDDFDEKLYNDDQVSFSNQKQSDENLQSNDQLGKNLDFQNQNEIELNEEEKESDSSSLDKKKAIDFQQIQSLQKISDFKESSESPQKENQKFNLNQENQQLMEEKIQENQQDQNKNIDELDLGKIKLVQSQQLKQSEEIKILENQKQFLNQNSNENIITDRKTKDILENENNKIKKMSYDSVKNKSQMSLSKMSKKSKQSKNESKISLEKQRSLPATGFKKNLKKKSADTILDNQYMPKMSTGAQNILQKMNKNQDYNYAQNFSEKQKKQSQFLQKKIKNYNLRRIGTSYLSSQSDENEEKNTDLQMLQVQNQKEQTQNIQNRKRSSTNRVQQRFLKGSFNEDDEGQKFDKNKGKLSYFKQTGRKMTQDGQNDSQILQKKSFQSKIQKHKKSQISQIEEVEDRYLENQVNQQKLQFLKQQKCLENQFNNYKSTVNNIGNMNGNLYDDILSHKKFQYAKHLSTMMQLDDQNKFINSSIQNKNQINNQQMKYPEQFQHLEQAQNLNFIQPRKRVHKQSANLTNIQAQQQQVQQQTQLFQSQQQAQQQIQLDQDGKTQVVKHLAQQLVSLLNGQNDDKQNQNYQQQYQQLNSQQIQYQKEENLNYNNNFNNNNNNNINFDHIVDYLDYNDLLFSEYGYQNIREPVNLDIDIQQDYGTYCQTDNIKLVLKRYGKQRKHNLYQNFSNASIGFPSRAKIMKNSNLFISKNSSFGKGFSSFNHEKISNYNNNNINASNKTKNNNNK